MQENISQEKNDQKSALFIKLKKMMTYVPFSVIVILLIFLFFEQKNYSSNIQTQLNSLSLEVKTIKSSIVKDFNDSDDLLNSISGNIQKLSAINQDEAKALSTLAEDTGFLKKWIVENNTTTLKSIDEFKKELNTVKNSLESIKTKVGELKESFDDKLTPNTSAVNVDAVSI